MRWSRPRRPAGGREAAKVVNAQRGHPRSARSLSTRRHSPRRSVREPSPPDPRGAGGTVWRVNRRHFLKALAVFSGAVSLAPRLATAATLEEAVRPFQIAPWPATAPQPTIVAGGVGSPLLAAIFKPIVSRWQGSTDPTVRKAVATLRRMESHDAMREAYLTLRRMERASESESDWECGKATFDRYAMGLISAKQVQERMGTVGLAVLTEDLTSVAGYYGPAALAALNDGLALLAEIAGVPGR